jgi:DNA processing protein
MNYHAALAHFPQITYRRYQKLVSYFSNLENLWSAELNEVVTAGLDSTIADAFINWREKFPAEKLLSELETQYITTVSIDDPRYPRLLKEINDPAHTLFVRGSLDSLTTSPALAIVGTRKLTMYGRQITDALTTDLTKHGLVIVSGLALGIDGVAHEAALRNHGKTIAVLGSGVDTSHIYPSSHRQLAEKIISSGGAIVSEYPPGFMPTNYSFPARNRIIAGLTLGTLVTEAPLESGALITARCALDYNRDVFAVPHPITSNSGAGNNRLLKQGAAVVTEAADVIQGLQLKEVKQVVTKQSSAAIFTPVQEKILNTLSAEPQSIDAIVKMSGLEPSTVNGQLTLLELDGHIKNLGGMRYIKMI